MRKRCCERLYFGSRISVCITICVGMLLITCVTPPPQPPAPPPPIIEEFSSDPSGVLPRYPSTLKWSVTGASVVNIEPFLGAVESHGTRLLFPSENITFTLTAANAAGKVARTVTLLACHNCGCDSWRIPHLEGWEQYVDTVSCFTFHYPAAWIIDGKRFSTLNSLAGGVLSGVSVSNSKTGSDHAYLDVMAQVRTPDFDYKAYAAQYQVMMREEGYQIASENRRPGSAHDPDTIIQIYDYIRDNRQFDCQVWFIVHDGKFWIVKYEGPNDAEFGMHRTAFSFLRSTEE